MKARLLSENEQGRDGTASQRRWVRAAALATACLLLWAGTADVASADRTRVQFLLNATTDFAPHLTDTTAAEQRWMRSHYSRMRGYPPFHTWHTFADAPPWEPPPTDFYKDLYGIFRDFDGSRPLCDNPNSSDPYCRDQYGELHHDQRLICKHPDWVLRASPSWSPPQSCHSHSGIAGALYISDGCDDGHQGCPQFAADISNPGYRQYWIEAARKTLTRPYRGIFIDDVDLLAVTNGRISDSGGNGASAIYNHQGQRVTNADWQRYAVEFLEQIRAAFPSVRITHNSLWWLSHNNPMVRRQIAAADAIELERGFNDSGLTASPGRYSYRRFLRHVKWLHGRGKSVVLEPYLENKRQAKYELANYFLVRRGDDAIASDYRSRPSKWWGGWRSNLGPPKGKVKRWHGLYRRNFRRGVALVNPRGKRPKQLSVPARIAGKAAGGGSRRVRLGPGEGKLLRKR